jgi:DNA-binding NarL/FixJ family response regulator
MDNPVRLLIVDDHSAYAEALCLLLGLDKRIDVAATVHTAADACKVLRNDHVDVVLMDISLGRSDGFSLTRDLLDVNPDVRVIILSSYACDEAGVTEKTTACGATAFMTKSSQPEEIADAVVAATQRAHAA